MDRAEEADWLQIVKERALYKARIKILHDYFKEFAPTGQVARPSQVPGSEVEDTPEQHAYRIALEAINFAKEHDQPTPEWARGVEQDAVGVFLNLLQLRFSETHDPICVADAWGFARHAKVDIPGWVIEWLDRGFLEFRTAMQGETNFEKAGFEMRTLPDKLRPGEAFAKAFGVRDSVTRKGYDNLWIHFGNHVLKLAFEDHRDGRPIKEMAIVSGLSEKYGFGSPETAWRAWARFKRCFPEKVAWISNSRQRRDSRRR